MSTSRKKAQAKTPKPKVTLESKADRVQYNPSVTREELTQAAKRRSRSRSPHRVPSGSVPLLDQEEEEEATEAAVNNAMSVIKQTSSLAEAIELLKQMVTEITSTKSPQEQMMKDIKDIKETLNKLEESIAAISRQVNLLSLSGIVGKAIPSTATVDFSAGETLYPQLPHNAAGPSAPPPPVADDYPF
nr:TPA_asm: phosphoprotein [Wuhan sharpbelly bornavirus]